MLPTPYTMNYCIVIIGAVGIVSYRTYRTSINSSIVQVEDGVSGCCRVGRGEVDYICWWMYSVGRGAVLYYFVVIGSVVVVVVGARYLY